MHSLPTTEAAAPPRLVRAVCLQLLALTGAALILSLPWPRGRKAAPTPEPEVKPRERKIRIVQLPKPPPAPKTEPAPAKPVAAPQRPAPAPAQSTARQAPAAPAPLARIAADSTAMHGVRMRVLVPRSPAELAAHLRNSGACLVVSRLSGSGAEVLSVLALDGQRVVEMSGPPCPGVPRLLRDAALNEALGDPLGRVRLQSPGDVLALQVNISPRLPEIAQAALLPRFGPVSEA